MIRGPHRRVTENATLNALMEQQDYLRQFGVDALIAEAPGATGPFDAIAAGAADICMVSGYNMVLSRIEQGARVKIACAGMRKTALTVFAKPDGIETLADLQGRTVAVGPKLALLHALQLFLVHCVSDRAVQGTNVAARRQLVWLDPLSAARGRASARESSP
jgi:hypothetical protein